MEQAQLQGADLWGAELQGAHLVLAQLQGANLQHADLYWDWESFMDSGTALVDLRFTRWTPLNAERLAQMREVLGKTIAASDVRRAAIERIERTAETGLASPTFESCMIDPEAARILSCRAKWLPSEIEDFRRELFAVLLEKLACESINSSEPLANIPAKAHWRWCGSGTAYHERSRSVTAMRTSLQTDAPQRRASSAAKMGSTVNAISTRSLQAWTGSASDGPTVRPPMSSAIIRSGSAQAGSLT
ncbi:MAG: pentapeptide repeat-containing protein [Gammaproteobacteria bacterium]